MVVASETIALILRRNSWAFMNLKATYFRDIQAKGRDSLPVGNLWPRNGMLDGSQTLLLHTG
jgi:hypothetical protein